MTDVMYQPYTYSAYFPYQRHFADQKFHSLNKLSDPFSSDHYPANLKSDNHGIQPRPSHHLAPAYKPDNFTSAYKSHDHIHANVKADHFHAANKCDIFQTSTKSDILSLSAKSDNFPLAKPNNLSKSATCLLLAKPAFHSPLTKSHDVFSSAIKLDDKGAEPTDTRYLNANCVLLTYFSGDIASHVDEHFNRALNQPKSLMCHRNFPLSFWNSSFTPQTNHDLQLSAESFMSSIHSLSNLHQDSWHYHVPAQAHHYNHRTAIHHDYPYQSTAARYPAHYTPLFVQPAVPISSRISGCDVARSSADVWNARYHGDPHRIASEFSTRSHLEPSLAVRCSDTQYTYPSFMTS